jgi:hypothetical protein
MTPHAYLDMVPHPPYFGRIPKALSYNETDRRKKKNPYILFFLFSFPFSKRS